MADPGAHPRVDRLEQGVEIGQARTDDADVELKPGPDSDFDKVPCTDGMLEIRARRNQMTFFRSVEAGNIDIWKPRHGVAVVDPQPGGKDELKTTIHLGLSGAGQTLLSEDPQIQRRWKAERCNHNLLVGFCDRVNLLIVLRRYRLTATTLDPTSMISSEVHPSLTCVALTRSQT